MKESMNKLNNVISELKAPKNNQNNFGKYKYRSCEDILEAVKPLLVKNELILSISDTIENIGNRYYIKAVCIIRNFEGIVISETTAYARESELKKGMDDAQITGATSSYARKYALNGLFCIDDTKDSDTDEYKHIENKVDKSLSQLDAVIDVFHGEVVNNFKSLLYEIHTKINQGCKLSDDYNKSFCSISSAITSDSLPKRQEQAAYNKLQEILKSMAV